MLWASLWQNPQSQRKLVWLSFPPRLRSKMWCFCKPRKSAGLPQFWHKLFSGGSIFAKLRFLLACLVLTVCNRFLALYSTLSVSLHFRQVVVMLFKDFTMFCVVISLQWGQFPRRIIFFPRICHIYYNVGFLYHHE